LQAIPTDHQYKNAFVNFITSLEWHWFTTIPIGECPDEDEVLLRLRHIEAQLCKKYLVNRYDRLPDWERFSMAVAFEGEAKCGTRHAHILIYVPRPMKKSFSHGMLVDSIPFEFQFLWSKSRRAGRHPLGPWSPEKDFLVCEIGEDAFRMIQQLDQEPALRFGRANVARSIYAVKNLRAAEVPWSRFEFVTPPKFGIFDNENLSVVRNRGRQKRFALGLQ
jgi:hypothetical protein